MPVRTLSRTLLCVLALFLASCGFQLRGLPEAQFHTLYISGSLGGAADQELKQEILHQTHLSLVTKASEADVILYLKPVINTQQILTLTYQGEVSQYTLFSRLSYRATDNLGDELIPPSSLTASRLFNYNVVQILGKPAEQTLLVQDMQIDLVHQMMRRVLALHPTLGNADKPATAPTPVHGNHHQP